MNKCLDCGKDISKGSKRCKECHRKFSGKSFNFGSYHFNTQKDLDRAIKLNIQYMPFNKEIDDDFLLAVINNLHSDVKKKDLKCTKIKILDWKNQIGEWLWIRRRFRGGIFILGFFEPIHKWHGVTLYPHKRGKGKIKQKLISCLRQKWSEQAEMRRPYTICEKCGSPNPQLHHDNIPFKEIAKECLKYFSQKELEEGVGDDWWWHESEADAIPDSHPAVQHMIKLHSKVNYRWLCKNCHQKEHSII